MLVVVKLELICVAPTVVSRVEIFFFSSFTCLRKLKCHLLLTPPEGGEI